MTTEAPTRPHPPGVLAGRRWIMLVALIANGVVQAGAAVVTGLSVEHIFGLIGAAEQPGTRALAAPAAALAGAGVALALLRARERVDAERMGQGYTHAMRLHLHRHLIGLSPRTLQTQSQGSTALRFVGDLTAVRRWVSLGLARLVVAAALISTTAVALAVISPVLAIAVIAVVSSGALVATFRAPAQRDKEREVRRRRARLAGNVTEQIVALGAIQANGAADREQRRFRRQSRRLREASVARATELGKLEATTEATTAAATLAVLVAAFVSGLDGSATAGALAMVGIMSSQVRGLSRVQEYRQGAVVAREAIGRFLAKPTSGANRGTAAFPPGPGLLELDGVAVDGSLAPDDAIAVPGRRIAVIGPNGAGKSTLLSVVAQLTEPTAGRVRLDGVDLAHIALPDVHRAVGLVSSDLPLMRGSVRDNIVYGRPDIGDDELAAAVRLCGLDATSALPGGLETPVRERGRALSAGQRQRVHLARALLGRPRVLLLDEVDANLDPTTVAIVDDVIRHFAGTCLMVTHRRERVEEADEAWFLERGGPLIVGPATTLLVGDGPAARLFSGERSVALGQGLSDTVA